MVGTGGAPPACPEPERRIRPAEEALRGPAIRVGDDVVSGNSTHKRSVSPLSRQGLDSTRRRPPDLSHLRPTREAHLRPTREGVANAPVFHEPASRGAECVGAAGRCPCRSSWPCLLADPSSFG